MHLRPRQALTRLCLLPSLLAGALLSTGCALTPPKPAPGALRVTVSPSLRGPCPRPTRPADPSVGQLAGFSVRQEAALGICEARKDAVVDIVDAMNAAAQRQARALQPAPWWAFWRR